MIGTASRLTIPPPGGNMPTFSFNFSRPGSQVVAQYYLFLRLGREGYAAIHGNSSKVGKYIADEVAKFGLFDIVYDGIGGIPGAAWAIKKDLKPQPTWTLYDVSLVLVVGQNAC